MTTRALLHFFFLSRPYSYADNVARAIMACALAGMAGCTRCVAATSAASLMMWLFLNWYSERHQKQEERLVPPLWLVWLPWCGAAVIASISGVVAVGGLIVYTMSIFLYPVKATIAAMGPFGPVLRGLTVVAHFVFMLSLTGMSIFAVESAYSVVPLVFFIHTARNLVGDIRDIHKDRFEFPARYGFQAAFWLTRMLLGAGLVTAIALDRAFLEVTALIVMMWLGLETIAWYAGCNRPDIIGYVGHRSFVLMFTLMQVVIAIQYGFSLLFGVVLVMTGVALNFTYRFTPGKKFPRVLLPTGSAAME